MARKRKLPPWLRPVKHGLEAAFAYAALGVFRLLPVDVASACGGWLMRQIGPRLGAARRARRGLSIAFPGISDAEAARILTGMWDNLGRVIAEYAHLHHLWTDTRVEVIGRDQFQALIDDGLPAIAFSGHLANWELCAIGAGRNGLPLDLVYRAPNNPIIDRLIARLRGQGGSRLIPKGPAGARTLLLRLRAGAHAAMLLDQKMNDGVAVPFFGQDAMTAPAAAALALKFRCPLVPVHVERLSGAHFRVTVEPPLPLPDSGNRADDTAALLRAINQRLESWIRAHPDQWLWTHSRWPDEAYRAAADRIPE